MIVYCIIVDAYSSGNLLARVFKKKSRDLGHELSCVHIQSDPNFSNNILSSFNAEDFEKEMIFKGHLEELIKLLLLYSNVICVLPGSETGVELADKVSEALNECGLSIPTNGTEKSLARRDKSKMLEALQESDLRIRTIPSKKVGSLDEVSNWIKKIDYPIIVKPLDSAGGDSVCRCDSWEDIENAFLSIVNRRSKLEKTNKFVLIQKMMIGEEYVVDTVSCRGCHYVVAIWQISRGWYNGCPFVCEFTELLHYDMNRYQELVDYTRKVLDSLSISFGAGHCEIIVDSEGPVLLEVGARMHGAGFPDLCKESLDYTQVELTVDSYIDEQAFKEKTCEPYRCNRHLRILELISEVEGRIKSKKISEAAMLRYPSYSKMKTLGIGDRIQKTVDVFTSPGWIALVHENYDVVDRDYQMIRKLEKKGFFEVVNG